MTALPLNRRTDTVEAFIQTASTRPDGTREAFLTHRVDYRHTPMPHHRRGLTWTASGYGARIPTEHMVNYGNRWRRVYCYRYSNIGTLFIGRSIRDGLIVNLQG